jgi:hypothetical protein
MRVVTPALLILAFAEARAFACERARPRRSLCAMLALHPVTFAPIARLQSPPCSS